MLVNTMKQLSELFSLALVREYRQEAQFDLEDSKIFRQTSLKERSILLHGLPSCHMPSTSGPALCRARVKYKVHRISC